MVNLNECLIVMVSIIGWQFHSPSQTSERQPLELRNQTSRSVSIAFVAVKIGGEILDILLVCCLSTNLDCNESEAMLLQCFIQRIIPSTNTDRVHSFANETCLLSGREHAGEDPGAYNKGIQ